MQVINKCTADHHVMLLLASEYIRGAPKRQLPAPPTSPSMLGRPRIKEGLPELTPLEKRNDKFSAILVLTCNWWSTEWNLYSSHSVCAANWHLHCGLGNKM